MAGTRLFVAALALAACDGPPCDGATVSVRWEGGALDVCAAVARTAAERAAGLTARPALGDGEGLVLDFPTEGEVCLVNGGVPYAVDGVHVAGDGRVTGVTCGMPPGDETPRCHGGTRWVLELASPAGCAVPVGATATRTDTEDP